MKYFIGIVPPLVSRERIEEVQNNFPSNRVSIRVEPHITVKSSVGLTEDRLWLVKVMSLVGSFPRFQVHLDSLDKFGDSILFLKPAHNEELQELHEKVKDIVLAGSGEEENYPEYNPHLTLGKVSPEGMTKDELEEMERQAETEFLLARPIPPFQVDFLRVYQSEGNEPYEKLIDIPLEL